MEPISLFIGFVGVVVAIYYGERQLRSRHPSEVTPKPNNSSLSPEQSPPEGATIPSTDEANDNPHLNNAATVKTRVFISNRRQQPDLSLADKLYESLTKAKYQVFMAHKSLKVGENWPQRLDEEINACDYFLVIFSPQSANSEMIMEEVRRAKELRDEQENRKPVILPILVNCEMNSLNHDLRGYLYGIQYLKWRSPDDASPILQQILEKLLEQGDTPSLEATVKGLPLIDPIQINPDDPPSSVAPPQLPPGQPTDIYVERSPIEQQCYDAILNPDTGLIRIKAPQLMGKTKLMARILYNPHSADLTRMTRTFDA